MRLRNLLAVLSAATLVAPLALASQAQNPLVHDPSAQDTTTANATTTAPSLTPEQIALIDRYLTQVHAQVVGKIDTKNAAAGQGITLQTTQDATLANDTQLPKGTRLTGRILRTRSWQPEGPAALLSIDIDRAVLKDGTTIPIRCVLRTLVATTVQPNGMMDASQPGSNPRRGRGSSSSSVGGPLNGTIPLGNPTPMGGGSMGTDPNGGDMSNAPLGGASGNSNPNPRNTGNVGIPTGDAGIGGSGTRSQFPNTTAVPATAAADLPVTAAGENIHDTPHRTGIPGVMLSGASVTGVSGTLSAFDQNFSLDSGTQLTLGIITR